MTGRISEADWQAQVIDLARIHGWIVAHFRPARTVDGWRTPVSADGKGFPDLVLARRPRVIFAELKSETGKVTAEQMLWLKELPNACVWRPSDLDLVAEVLR